MKRHYDFLDIGEGFDLAGQELDIIYDKRDFVSDGTPTTIDFFTANPSGTAGVNNYIANPLPHGVPYTILGIGVSLSHHAIMADTGIDPREILQVLRNSYLTVSLQGNSNEVIDRRLGQFMDLEKVAYALQNVQTAGALVAAEQERIANVPGGEIINLDTPFTIPANTVWTCRVNLPGTVTTLPTEAEWASADQGGTLGLIIEMQVARPPID